MWGVIVKEVELQVDLRIGRIELGKKRKSRQTYVRVALVWGGADGPQGA